MTRLRDLFDAELINLQLKNTSRNDVIRELVSMLKLDAEAEERLCKQFIRQQIFGATMGRGFTFVYGRTPVASELRAGFGRNLDGIDIPAIDSKPVYYAVLVVAPAKDANVSFLKVLHRLSILVKEPDVPDLLARVETVEDFLQLIDAKDSGES